MTLFGQLDKRYFDTLLLKYERIMKFVVMLFGLLPSNLKKCDASWENHILKISSKFALRGNFPKS